MNTTINKAPSALDWARWWPAPAKLNVFLHVLGQREDKYHELETVFQLLDLQDNLQFSARDDGLIVRTEGDDSIQPDDDIIVHAARLLRKYVLEHKKDISKYCTAGNGVSIRCRKRIPMQAGLGGGSSDAASTLIVLDHLWECGLSISELLHLATQLGADVPVFVFGHSAYARGIGERLTPINMPESWYLIVKPQVSIATQKIFTHHGLTRDTDAITIHRFIEELKDWPEHLPGRNDCQAVVCKEFPEVAQVIDWLDNFGNARLTGTGSSVFLPCKDQNTAKAILDQLSLSQAAQDWQLMIAQGLNVSPLRTILSEKSWAKGMKYIREKKLNINK